MGNSLKDKIIGTWKLLSWVYRNDNSEAVHYFGEDVYGILMYDRAGNMNAQLTRAGREKFSADSINGGNIEEVEKAFKSYLAYFGKYYENAPGEIVHVVEGSLFPNWIGQEQLRYGRIEDNYLYLSTPPIAISGSMVQFHLKWERME
jgi:hypothetical protein